MDIITIIKKLDLSAIKIIALRIFNKQALYEYVLDKANTAVNLLLAAHKDTIATIRDKMSQFNGYLVRYAEYIPAPWVPDAQRINQLLLEIYAATEDYQVVGEEAKAIVEKFQIAYSGFKSED